MSFLRRLFGRRPDAPKPASTPAEIAAAVAAAKADLRGRALPAVALAIQRGEPVPASAKSSIGGRPSLAPDEPWPVDANDAPLLFLAQLALSELPELPGFPAEGLLSFFAESNDDTYLGDRCTVLWHPTIEGLERRPDPAPERSESIFGPRLLAEGAPLASEAFTCLPGGTSSDFDAADATHGAELDKDGRDELSETLWEWLEEEVEQPAHNVGGHPRFVQNDARGPEDEVLLLHLGWESDVPDDWRVCIGDAGDANVFVSAADLEARRFDRAKFLWDCG